MNTIPTSQLIWLGKIVDFALGMEYDEDGFFKLTFLCMILIVSNAHVTWTIVQNEAETTSSNKIRGTNELHLSPQVVVTYYGIGLKVGVAWENLLLNAHYGHPSQLKGLC